MVDVSEQEVVYGTVPVAGVLVKGYAVPPCSVETSIGEPCDLCEHVEQTLPYDVPAKQLLKKHREKHVGDCEIILLARSSEYGNVNKLTNPRELLPSLLKRHASFFLSHSLDDYGVDVGLRDDDHNPDNS